MITLQLLDKDPASEEVRCCFCRTPTPFWTAISGRKTGQQVACCEHCASRANPQNVPSKEDWCQRERIARRPTVGEVSQGRDRNYPKPTILQGNTTP